MSLGKSLDLLCSWVFLTFEMGLKKTSVRGQRGELMSCKVLLGWLDVRRVELEVPSNSF